MEMVSIDYSEDGGRKGVAARCVVARHNGWLAAAKSSPFRVALVYLTSSCRGMLRASGRAN